MSLCLGTRGEPGPYGPDIVPGKVGPPGQDGYDALDGPKGFRGDVGERGLFGAPGKKGQAGTPGPSGPSGINGQKVCIRRSFLAVITNIQFNRATLEIKVILLILLEN